MRARRQRGRRRDRRQRGARPDRADGQRPRRRPVRDRLGSRRPGRLHGLNGSGRSPRSLTLAELQQRGLDAHPAARPAAGDGARLRRRLVRAARRVRQAADGSGARAGDPLRARGLSRQRADRLLLAAERARPRASTPASPRPSCPAAGRRAKGEIFRNPALAATLDRDRQRRPRRVLRRADRRRHRRLHGARGRLPVARGPRGASQRVGRAGLDELPRTSRCGSCRPTARASPRCRSSTSSRASTWPGAGFGSAGPPALFRRGQEARLRGPRAVLRRPRLRRRAGRRADHQGVRGRAPRADPAASAPRAAIPPAIRHSNDGDTIYLTTADEQGNMVSLIQSNYRGMGSGMCPDGLGFGLQDRGELFDLTEGRANTYAPGKRPFHTIIPAFVTQGGEPWLAFGVMGGAHAAAGAGADRHEPGRLRHEPAGGRRRAARPARRMQRADRRAHDRRRRGLRRERLSRGDRARADGARPRIGPHRRRLRRLPGHHARSGPACTTGRTESRKDGQAAGY